MIYLLILLFFLCFVTGIYHHQKKLPAGLAFESFAKPAEDMKFYRDLTWIDQDGTDRHDHQIFNEVNKLIQGARQFILLDMFLYNDMRGAVDSGYRDLSSELTEALVKQKMQYPGMEIILVTDPVNTVYGGYVNPYFTRLKISGVKIVLTDLDALRDSNFLYSPFWRLFVKPFKNSPGGILPNPFGPGRVGFRSYLRMFNFKANHRKLIIADNGRDLSAIVTSANPHDGSSSHGNVGIGFSGPAVRDLLASEEAVLAFSSTIKLPTDYSKMDSIDSSKKSRIRIVTESRIKKAVLDAVAGTEYGDQVLLVMFYLADRDIVSALKKASRRGVSIRAVFDPNKDAFGRTKKGIPNRQVAAELVKEGIAVRWGNTHGEQLHSKIVLVDYKNGESCLTLGSANFTRRNLDNYNLETNVVVSGKEEERVFRDARDYFTLLWAGDSGRKFSVDYSIFADESLVKKLLYRVIEATGVCTF